MDTFISIFSTSEKADETTKEWKLEFVKEYELSGKIVHDMHPTPSASVAVGYKAGGIEIFNIKERHTKVLEDVNVAYLCRLLEDRYLVCDGDGNITFYNKEWNKLPIIFQGNLGNNVTGVCVDKYDNIFVGSLDAHNIRVFRPEGGEAIDEIPRLDFPPWNIRHMHNSKLLVLKNYGDVKVIDKNGTVQGQVSKEGYYATPVVLQDDNILIGWEKDAILTIELYTSLLKFVRTVLQEYKTDKHLTSNFIQSLAEFSSEEIAYNNPTKLYIFKKV